MHIKVLEQLLEEGIKFKLLIFFCVRLCLNEPMDAIVYGAAIGLGYGTENVGYLSSSSLENAWTIQMVKTRYYPCYAYGVWSFNGVVNGQIYLKKEIFKRRIMLILSLSLPIVFHGV